MKTLRNWSATTASSTELAGPPPSGIWPIAPNSSTSCSATTAASAISLTGRSRARSELQRDRALEPEPYQPDTKNLQNEPAPAKAPKQKLQNEPERLAKLAAVLPIEDARRLLHTLRTYPKTTRENK